MTLNEAVERANRIKPMLGEENQEAVDVLIDETKPGISFTVRLNEERLKEQIHDIVRDLDDCENCLRQGCEYRGAEVFRVNCPLFMSSAV